MLQVWLSTNFTAEIVREALSEFWVGVKIKVGKDWQTVLPPVGFDRLPWVGALLYDNASEFPLSVDVSAPSADIYEDQIRLARFLSLRLGCRTLCDGSRHGNNDSPYWCIIGENGRAYLGDNCDTVLADGEGGPVRIVGPLEIDLPAEPLCNPPH